MERKLKRRSQLKQSEMNRIPRKLKKAEKKKLEVQVGSKPKVVKSSIGKRFDEETGRFRWGCRMEYTVTN